MKMKYLIVLILLFSMGCTYQQGRILNGIGRGWANSIKQNRIEQRQQQALQRQEYTAERRHRETVRAIRGY